MSRLWQLVVRSGSTDLLRLPLDRGHLILGPDGTQLAGLNGELTITPEQVVLSLDGDTHVVSDKPFTKGTMTFEAKRDDRPVGSTRSLPRLEVVRGTRLRVGTRTVSSGQLTVGTDPSSDVVISSQYASAFHCVIFQRNGLWFVRDLDSKNGTFLNEIRVREAELPAPAHLRAGDITLTIEADEPEEGEVTGLFGHSPAMVSLRAAIRRMAIAPAPAMIFGESGTGKELVAKALHAASARRNKPFIAINCGALAASLVESELFGHTRGAFTGAADRRQGAFMAAHGGTLFLDEIGELPLELQPKLLRVLETREVKAVGEDKVQQVDVRLIAATHRDLAARVDHGEFREDLFHRLSVLKIDVPPLRERGDDALALARIFLRELAPEGRAVRLTERAEMAIRGNAFPGNVRELKNAVVRGMWTSPSGVIDRDHLGLGTASAPVTVALKTLERSAIVEALRKADGSRAETAKILDIARSTLYRKLEEYGITDDDLRKKKR